MCTHNHLPQSINNLFNFSFIHKLVSPLRISMQCTVWKCQIEFHVIQIKCTTRLGEFYSDYCLICVLFTIDWRYIVVFTGTCTCSYNLLRIKWTRHTSLMNSEATWLTTHRWIHNNSVQLNCWLMRRRHSVAYDAQWADDVFWARHSPSWWKVRWRLPFRHSWCWQHLDKLHTLCLLQLVFKRTHICAKKIINARHMDRKNVFNWIREIFHTNLCSWRLGQSCRAGSLRTLRTLAQWRWCGKMTESLLISLKDTMARLHSQLFYRYYVCSPWN